MPDFFFSIPAKVHFGIDVIRRIGSFCSPYTDRVLLVTEAILYENNTIERVQEFLDKMGIKYITFDEVVPNVTSTAVDRGINLARKSHVNGVIGLGGVKTLSTAKCIAMGTGSKRSMDDFLSGEKPENKPLTYIEVPTTCRNPFMFTPEYLIVDARNRKGVVGRAQEDITKVIIIDPVLSTSLPPKYTATTIMDTLLAAIEGYISNKSTFFSDMLFCEGIKIIGSLFPHLLENPEDSMKRYEASRAALLITMGLSICKPGIGTGIAWAINASQMVPKSWVAAILLPHVLEYYISSSGEKLAYVASLLDDEIRDLPIDEAARRGIDVAGRLLGSLGIPTRLQEFDLILDNMVGIAETTHSYEMMKYLSRTITPDEIFAIIKSAY